MQGVAAAACCCAARVDTGQLSDTCSQARQRLRDALVALGEGAAQKHCLGRGVRLLLQLAQLLSLALKLG